MRVSDGKSDRATERLNGEWLALRRRWLQIVMATRALATTNLTHRRLIPSIREYLILVVYVCWMDGSISLNEDDELTKEPHRLYPMSTRRCLVAHGWGLHMAGAQQGHIVWRREHVIDSVLWVLHYDRVCYDRRVYTYERMCVHRWFFGLRLSPFFAD